MIRLDGYSNIFSEVVKMVKDITWDVESNCGKCGSSNIVAFFQPYNDTIRTVGFHLFDIDGKLEYVCLDCGSRAEQEVTVTLEQDNYGEPPENIANN